MVAIVRVEWHRDSKGYDIVEGPDPLNGPKEEPSSGYQGGILESASNDGVWIKPRGGKSLRYVLEGVENRVFEHLANTPCTLEGALEFTNQWGLLTPMRVPLVEDVRIMIRDLRSALKLVERGDYDRLERAVKKIGVGPLQLRFGRMLGDSTSRVFVEPKSLFHFCWLELLQVVAAQVKIQSCLNCGAYFSVGLEKGSRKTRQYCSPRCRLAMHRKHKRPSGKQ